MLRILQILIPALPALIVLVVIMQNLEHVQLDFLFWTFELPRLVLLLIVFLSGYLVGALWLPLRSPD